MASQVLLDYVLSDEDDVDLMHILDSSSSDSSSSSDESDVAAEVSHEKVQNFLETIEAYSDSDFQKNFRMERHTVNFLINLYEESDVLPNIDGGGRTRVGCSKEIYLYIWYMSNTITFRQLGNLFGISKSASWNVVVRLTEWINRS